jgi:hypothetical protein
MGRRLIRARRSRQRRPRSCDGGDFTFGWPRYGLPPTSATCRTPFKSPPSECVYIGTPKQTRPDSPSTMPGYSGRARELTGAPQLSRYGQIQAPADFPDLRMPSHFGWSNRTRTSKQYLNCWTFSGRGASLALCPLHDHGICKINAHRRAFWQRRL